MTAEEFRRLVDAARVDNPIWFELESDPVASSEDVARAESALAVSFPDSYKEFATNYGGGLFALGNVYSVDPNSEWFVVEKNREIARPGFLAVSENGVGDYFGFLVHDQRCDSRIMFLDHEGGRLEPTAYLDLFQYLAGVALHG